MGFGKVGSSRSQTRISDSERTKFRALGLPFNRRSRFASSSLRVSSRANRSNTSFEPFPFLPDFFKHRRVFFHEIIDSLEGTLQLVFLNVESCFHPFKEHPSPSLVYFHKMKDRDRCS